MRLTETGLSHGPPPERNERWTIGLTSGAMISWLANNLSGTITIDLYDNGAYYTTIATAVPVANSVLYWTVPVGTPAGKKYSIYIESVDFPEVNAESKTFWLVD